MNPAIASVLTSRTLWLAVLTAVLPPLLRACGVVPEAVLSDEAVGALATVGALIAAARLTTTAPVHRRRHTPPGPSAPAPPPVGVRPGGSLPSPPSAAPDAVPEAPSLVFPPEPRP